MAPINSCHFSSYTGRMIHVTDIRLGNTNNYYRREQSPILKSSITREIRSIAKSDSKKAKKMTEKELELERKMDRKGQNKLIGQISQK